MSGSETARLHRDDDLLREPEVAHQGGAGAPLEHLVRRAAHVDVDQVGAELLDHPRGVGHGAGVGAVDLDRQRPLLVDEVHQASRLGVARDDRLGGDELHRHQPDAADAAHQEAEVAIGHAGHGREEERWIDRDRSEAEHGPPILQARRFSAGSGTAPAGRDLAAGRSSEQSE